MAEFSAPSFVPSDIGRVASGKRVSPSVRISHGVYTMNASFRDVRSFSLIKIHCTLKYGRFSVGLDYFRNSSHQMSIYWSVTTTSQTLKSIICLARKPSPVIRLYSWTVRKGSSSMNKSLLLEE
ncbi:hypothetical protein TNCV_4894161 [Trichonephila clavipes]|nr:hypothetical protein TNCV_4894161 [Trichonephila clavipes]